MQGGDLAVGPYHSIGPAQFGWGVDAICGWIAVGGWLY
jgi:hypothetical protein